VLPIESDTPCGLKAGSPFFRRGGYQKSGTKFPAMVGGHKPHGVSIADQLLEMRHHRGLQQRQPRCQGMQSK